MGDQRTPGLMDRPATADRSSEFESLLSEKVAQGPVVLPEGAGPAFLTDLRLAQVITAVAGKREERDLIAGLLREQVRDIGTLTYRHEVFTDLENSGLFDLLSAFSRQMQDVRAHLSQLAKMRSAQQREGWFLDAALIYCDAVRTLNAGLAAQPLTSRGLLAFRDYLDRYAGSPEFDQLAADTADRQSELARITYLVRIKGPRVEVSRYDGEPDYSAEIEETFARFRQGAVKDYLVKYRGWPGMNHVGEHIAELVARLFSHEFAGLEEFARGHAAFLDSKVRQFEQEIQFYLAYLDYLRPMRSAGLSFCLPEITADSKEIFARDTFDIALAAKLAITGGRVVTNDFELRDPERVIVVSGPNQGGKTTFARMFGQLHHLAGTGCPVPGTEARLYLFDQMFTHFEREEDIADLTGKLEDDLLRIQKALQAATSSSVVIMNEIFTSTTVGDARFLGRKVLDKIVELDLLCVYVTFIDELASFADSVVSMASTIVPGNPAERTYKVVRKPADGLAYALAIADKHGVTYQRLRQRITS